MFSSNLLGFSQSFLNFSKNLFLARWRSLLLLLLGVGIPLLIFEELAVEVWQNNGSFPWDDSFLLALHKASQPQLDAFAVVLTKFGSVKVVFPFSVVISSILLYFRRWRSLIYLVTTLLGTAFLNRTAKELLHRVRPQLWESLTPELDYGFPSGHAMTSMSLIAALVILTWGTRWSGWLIAIGSLYIVAIGWTRLYLGVHFPSDILAGWMVAIAWAIGVSLLIRPHLIKPSLVSEEATTQSEEKAIER